MSTISDLVFEELNMPNSRNILKASSAEILNQYGCKTITIFVNDVFIELNRDLYSQEFCDIRTNRRQFHQVTSVVTPAMLNVLKYFSVHRKSEVIRFIVIARMF